ncbi:hypothetical protein MUK42_35911 [Musa troglodytarum]|uniref:Uncharacterized protein n=1 Tax=Musa troglodytarum TaxID=320322 RepID=A0A9E7EBG8_9LILI|nr:hypothetical protein MUK42_35911 [Musa troglodytarum]
MSNVCSVWTEEERDLSFLFGFRRGLLGSALGLELYTCRYFSLQCCLVELWRAEEEQNHEPRPACSLPALEQLRRAWNAMSADGSVLPLQKNLILMLGVEESSHFGIWAMRVRGAL